MMRYGLRARARIISHLGHRILGSSLNDFDSQNPRHIDGYASDFAQSARPNLTPSCAPKCEIILARALRITIYIVILLVANGCNRTSTKETKSTGYFRVKRNTLEHKFSWRGFVRSANQIEIRAERKLKVAKVHVKNFQAVKKGDLLIEIDRTETESKKQELMDKLKSMDLELGAARVKYEHTSKVLNRKRTLQEKGIIAQKEFDEALREFRLSESDLKVRELDMEKARRELGEIEEQLKTANFHAPMEGMVSGLVGTDKPDELSAGQLLAMISDPKKLALRVQVEESHIHQLHVGGAARITLDSVPGTSFEGRVLELGINSNESQQGRMKLYDMSIGFDPKNTSVREGFSGQASVVYEKKETVISIPLTAIRYMDGKDFVLVSSAENSEGKPRQIRIGLKTDDEAEILSGVSENEFILIE